MRVQEGSEEEAKRRRGKPRHALDFLRFSWKESNNAERIFNLLPEKDTRCYSALIRGTVMVRGKNLWVVLPQSITRGISHSSLTRSVFQHGAPAKAFSFYTDMLNNRVAGESQTLLSLRSNFSRVPSTERSLVMCCVNPAHTPSLHSFHPPPGDVHIFNALISVAPDMREKYSERWDLINVSLVLGLISLFCCIPGHVPASVRP